MNNNPHETFRHMIDQRLAGDISAESDHSLREHLDACAPCREYLSAGNRAVAGLRGFSFTVDPALNAIVLSTLRRPVRPNRPHWALSSVAAIVLTIGGSAIDLRCAGFIASILDIRRVQVQHGLLAFWIVPSLCVLLLFPLLPLLSRAGSRRQERTQ